MQNSGCFSKITYWLETLGMHWTDQCIRDAFCFTVTLTNVKYFMSYMISCTVTRRRSVHGTRIVSKVFLERFWPYIYKALIKRWIFDDYNEIDSNANKGQSTVNYHQSSALDCPYLSCINHLTGGFSMGSFRWYYFYVLEILLIDLELVFLEFKHIYKTQRTSLFSFHLFIFYLLFCNHSLY